MHNGKLDKCDKDVYHFKGMETNGLTELELNIHFPFQLNWLDFSSLTSFAVVNLSCF